MPELMRLIQSHLDRYGVTRAEFARRIGTRPQTVQNWKDAGDILPAPNLIKGVAEVIDAPYLIVLDAALVDSGYRDTIVDDVPTLQQRIKKLADRDPSALRQLGVFVRQLESEYADSQNPQTRATADRIADLIRRELDADNGGNSGQ